jgi:hypothetical protein
LFNQRIERPVQLPELGIDPRQPRLAALDLNLVPLVEYEDQDSDDYARARSDDGSYHGCSTSTLTVRR